MSSRTIQVGIVGCGRIAGHHCRSIAETPGAELVAVCDLVAEKAESYASQFGTRAYTNYHEMLRSHPSIDAVAIMTPSGMHHEHALDILRRYRKHIIVEKPTFLRPSDVREAYAEAERLGARIYAVFQNRFNSAVQRVAQGIASGELGAVRTVAVRVRWCRPQRYYDLAPWRGTWAMDGGCLTNQGIHHVDLLRKLGGEITAVCSSLATLGAGIEVEDTSTATIRFAGGALGTLEVTTAARPIDYEASISLVCEHGLAQIGGIAVNELQAYSPDPAACAASSEDFAGNVYGHGHEKIYGEIVQSIRGGGVYSAPFEDVLSTIQTLNAFYVSDERGGWVAVGEAGDSARLGRPNEALANLYRTPSY